MVTADFALLSFVVLSALNFGTVRGGSQLSLSKEGRYARHRQRLAKRDDSQIIQHGTLEVGDSVTSIPVLTSTPSPPPRGPPRKLTTDPGDGPVTTAPTLDLGHTAAGQDGVEGSPVSDPSLDPTLSSSTSNPSTSQEPGSIAGASDTTYNTLQTDSGSVTSTPTVAPTVKPPGRPPTKPTTAAGGGPVTIPTLQLGCNGADNTFLSAVSGAPYNTLQTDGESVTDIPTPKSTTKPAIPGLKTTLPDMFPDTLDLGHSEDSSTSVVGMKATIMDTGSPGSSSAASYIDPQQFGAGGTLTIDTHVPTRTVGPSRSSIIPNSKSNIGPPPADMSTKRPPALPTLVQSGVVDPTSVASDDLSYLPPNAGTGALVMPTTKTPPGGRPPILPTTQPRGPTTTLPGLDFGHTAPATDDTVTISPTTKPPSLTSLPYFNSSYWANSTSISFNLSSLLPPLTQWSYSMAQSLTTDDRGNVRTICMPSDVNKPTTTYSVIYTSTITWYGDPNEYTAPYPTLSTPLPCIPPRDPLRLTLSLCSATRTVVGSDTSKYATCTSTTAAFTYSPAVPGFSANPAFTFVTTDKNPTVVFSSIATPDYGLSQPASRDQVVHTSASPEPTGPQFQSQVVGSTGGNRGVGGGTNPGPTPGSDNKNNGGSSTPTAANNAGNPGSPNGDTNGHIPAPTPIPVGVQPTAVVVNGQTVNDDPVSPSRVITVAGQPVTIDPTQVVVAGQTVTRPPSTGAVFIPSPTSTEIRGVPVSISSSLAIIGGTAFTLGSTPITTVVGGQAVTLGPSGVVVASTTIAVTSAAAPSATQVVIEGGELVTAIGPSVVVIHGTTVTYGPDRPVSTTVVDDDTITLGPSGVVVHGTTIGGVSANPLQTQYEIVGGATITQLGPSVVVINNATYTVGPSAKGTTTTVIGGETITIGPSGIAAGTHSIPYPFGPTTTITPRATGVVPTVSPTASKDAGIALRPERWLALACVAMGWLAGAV